jgi:hypothetical protein
LEALKMVRIQRTLKTLAAALAIVAQPVAGQSSASLTHTVSVTVPPRVKVQVGPVAVVSSTSIGMSSPNATTQAISLSVNANRAWVLSIGSVANAGSKTPIRWSRGATSGYTALPAHDVSIASGALSAQPNSAELYFRNVGDAKVENVADASEAQVVLTVTAP